MIAGRQILFLIDSHFRMSEMDGGVYDTEHLFSVKMKGEKLNEFIALWDDVLAGLGEGPDESTLQALLLRNLRQCKAMEQDIAHYDRKPPNDPEKSYSYLMRCARAVVDRNRLHWFRDEMSRSIGGGWVNSAVGKGKEKGNGKKRKSKDKSKGSSGNGDRKGGGKRDRGKSRGRSQSPDRKGKGGNRERSASRDGKTEVCRMHLLGKCKAGDSCSRIHNPPCRFFQKGACTKGKDCVFPHHQSTAVAAKSDEEPADGSTGEKRQARGRSKDKSRARSQTPGPKCGVCRASSWETGVRMFRACAAPTKGTNHKKWE